METLALTYPYFWVLLWVLFALFLFVKNSQKIKDKKGGFPLHELTVVIPFRDEKPNLKQLLDSILAQKTHPAQYIFVDDHSSDGGSQVILEYFNNTGVPFKTAVLSGALSGKKNALMEGIKMADTTYIQTLDADIWFGKQFFQNLPAPEDYDMMILPVRMVGKDAFTKLMELEYGTFQMLQAGVSRKKPLMASGANLIVNRTVYLETNDLSKHTHRSSGDDQYALAAFIKNKKRISTFFDLGMAIFTATPVNLNALLKQRARWMGNNTHGNDSRAAVLSIFIFLVNLAYLYILGKALAFGFSQEILMLITIKIAADFVVFFNWFKRNNTWHLAPYLPALSLLYPIYLVLLLVHYVVHRNQVWKNRLV